MKLKALGDAILFKFVDSSVGGFFATKSSGLIQIAKDNLDDQKSPRWGIVESVGPNVGEEIQVGKYILVDALKWTIGLRVDQADARSTIWKTTYPNVSAISDEEVLQY